MTCIGRTSAFSESLALQTSQSKPPYSSTPSVRLVSLSRSSYAPSVAQAYTRFPSDTATSSAWLNVAYGCSRLPSPFSSLPCGDTNTLSRSSNTQLSSWGHSVLSQLGSPIPPSLPAPALPPPPLAPLLSLLPPSPP